MKWYAFHVTMTLGRKLYAYNVNLKYDIPTKKAETFIQDSCGIWK